MTIRCSLWKQLSRKLLSSSFFINISTLASGNIIGAAISFGALPIIGRIYDQSELGAYNLFTSTCGIIGTLFQMALLLVVMIPKEECESIRLCKVVLLVNIIGCTIFSLCVAGISPWIKLVDFGIPYILTILLMGVFVLSSNVQSIFYVFSNRHKLYKVLFWNPIVMAGSNMIISICLGLLGVGAVGYLIGTLASFWFAIWHMHRFVNPFYGHDNIGELWQILKKYKKYPLMQLPANFISSLGQQISAQFLGHIFGVATLGGYTMACNILNVPISLLATPVNRVYFRELVDKLKYGNEAGKFAYSLLSKNIKLAIFPIGILMIFGNEITGIILGEEWRASGIFILIMGIPYLLRYCSACVSGTFVAVGRPRISLVFASLELLAYLGCFVIAWLLELDVVDTVILYAVFSSGIQLLSQLFCMHCLNYPKLKYVMFFFIYVLGSSAVILMLYAVRHCLIS